MVVGVDSPGSTKCVVGFWWYCVGFVVEEDVLFVCFRYIYSTNGNDISSFLVISTKP
jgi:hypothetical protein